MKLKQAQLTEAPPSTTHIHGHTAITVCEWRPVKMCSDSSSSNRSLLHAGKKWVIFDVFL